MALRRILGTGATTGAAITNGGTPGGQSLFANTVAGTGTLTWNATIPSGVVGKSIRLNCPSGTDTATCYFAANSAAPLAGSFYIYINSFGGAACNIAAFRLAGGQNGGINFTAGRILTITNSGGTPLKTFATAVPLTTWVRVDAWEDPATSSTGSVFFGYYLEHSTTPVETPLNVSNVNIGTTGDPTEFRIAKTTATGTIDAYIWGYADNSGATGPIGPASFSLAGDGTGASTGTADLTLVPGSTTYALAADGAGTSTGTATVGIIRQLVADGTGSSTGTATVTAVVRATAAGTGTTTGTAEVGIVRSLTAAGTGTSTGSASVTIVSGAQTYQLAADGTGTSTGAAVITVAPRTYTLGADGVDTSGGTADITATIRLTADGTGTSTGDAVITALLLLAADGLDATTGTAEITQHGAGRDITVTARLVATTYRAGLIDTNTFTAELVESAYTASIGDTVILGSTIYQHVALTADHDISADTVRISLNGGTDWYDLEHVSGTTDSTWRILLGDGQALDPAGDATALVQINDDPEVVIVNAGRFYVTTA